ncbi:MAG TPA: hypothetical protein VK928_09595 [Longimicrobiales bacterium]|nr:hypothetical protein [Longimicrobiales bacterium]
MLSIRHTRPTIACIVLVAVLLIAACEAETAPEGEAPGAVAVPDARGAAHDTAPASADSVATYDERVAVFLEATAADIDRVRPEYSEEDFAVVADDLMYYRATAYDVLDKYGVPIVRAERGTVLSFVVAGRPRRYDFSGESTLDAIVLYDPGREPRAFAPVDIHLLAEYFQFSVTGPGLDR